MASLIRLVLALGSAAVAIALTLGPGAVLAEADPAAWHEAEGHDAPDHDHGVAALAGDGARACPAAPR